MKKIEQIFSFLENEGVKVAEFERKAGLGNSYLAKTKERGSDITQKVLDKIQKSAPELYNKIFGGEGKALEAARPDAISSLAESNRVLSEANRTLADAHKILAEANKVLTVTQDRLARGNEELILMLKASYHIPTAVAPVPLQEADAIGAAEEELRRTGRTGPFVLHKTSKQSGSSGKRGK